MVQATALSLPKTRFGRIDGGYTQCPSRHNEDELCFQLVRAALPSGRPPWRLRDVCSSIFSTECGEIPSSANPGTPGEDTLSTCISST